jgi:site-specific DNA recombinase
MNKFAGIYIRTSTEAQGEKASPVEQESDCRKLAETMNLQVVKVYKDIERYRIGNKLVEPSGERSDRPALLEMISDALSGKIDTILAWKEDRLYRGVNKALLDISTLVTKNGINIFLVKENYDSKVAVVKAWAAQMELDAKSDRTRMGIKARLMQGKAWNLPTRLYGYVYNNETESLDIVKEEAHWINKIWEWFANGVSTNEIRQRLVANNAPQGEYNKKRKYDWVNRRILRLLDHESYHTGIQKIEWNNDVFEISIPIIITNKDVVNKVKERKSKYKAYPKGATKYPTLTQGLVYCYADNVRLIMAGARGGYKTKDGKVVRYPYYRCQNNKNKHSRPGCCKNIASNKLDREVWERLWKLISNEGGLTNAINKRVEELQSLKYTADVDKEKIEKQLGELFLERQEIISMRRKKLITEEDLEIQLNIVTKQEVALKKELNDVMIVVDNRLDSLLELGEMFTRQAKLGLENINKEPRNDKEKEFQFLIKQKIVQAFVRRIDLYEDHTFTVVTEINLKEGWYFFIDRDQKSLMNVPCYINETASNLFSSNHQSSSDNLDSLVDNRYIIQLII